MAAIDLIVLGMLKENSFSAYEIQKLVEYRNISRWVKISTPSIYKKVIQLESKGYLKGSTVKQGKMPEKEVYSLTQAGNIEFERLMMEIATKPIQIFLDFNAVIVNLPSLSVEKQRECMTGIEHNIRVLKSYIEENINKKQDIPEISEIAMQVLHQQYILTQSIETWIISLTEKLENTNKSQNRNENFDI